MPSKLSEDDFLERCWRIIPFAHSTCRLGAGRMIRMVVATTLDQEMRTSQL